MKILLIGEYSSVHTELCIALKKKGYFVKTLSDGDGYKSFPTDIKVNHHKNKSKNRIIFLISLLKEYAGITGIFYFIRIWRLLKTQIIGFDVVQIINPIALSGFGSIINLYFLNYLKRNNKNIFLGAFGDDYFWAKYSIENKSKCTILKGLNFIDYIRKSYSLKYVYGFLYKKLNNYAVKISTNVIPGIYDYQMVYKWCNKSTNLTPFPINTDRITSPLKIKIDDKVVIFNGWQKGKESRKGNDIFDKAVRKLCLAYPNKVEYIIVQNRTFEDYIKLFSSAHIFFDQCYSYDKGINGLLGMAAGKVVFSGFETEALNSYPFYDPLKEYGINAKPDEDYLYACLLELIYDHKRIVNISKNAIDFVLQNHLSDKIANAYLKIWEDSFSFHNNA